MIAVWMWVKTTVLVACAMAVFGCGASELRLATFRSDVTPAMGDTRTERAVHAGSDIHLVRSVSYVTRWRYQIVGTFMAGWYF